MLEYRVSPLPPWPGKATPSHARKRAPFKTIWTSALHRLERELRHLRARNVEIAVDVEPHHLRQDGQLRSNARPRTPAIIVSFDTPSGRLAFPCDTFLGWEANVDAVGRALEALRLVDRYGVQQGKQYTGFKAIPPATAPTLDAEQAAVNLVSLTGWREPVAPHVRRMLAERDFARDVARIVMSRTHPDRGGSAELFAAARQAMAALAAHHGVPAL